MSTMHCLCKFEKLNEMFSPYTDPRSIAICNEYIEKDEPYCMATRELESCNCDGDRSKCNFYMNMDKKDEKERD